MNSRDRDRVWKKWGLSPFLVLLLAACPGKEDDGPVVAPLPPKSVARLVAKEGTVTLTRGAKAQPAEVGPLEEKDVLETAAASKALLRAPGGRELELGENTRLEVGKSFGELEVTEGTISFLAPDEGDGGVVQVKTRFGSTAVAPGTRATLQLGEGGLSVDVSVGEIVQVGDDGGTRSVAAGQKLEFGVGSIELEAPVEPPKGLEVQLQPEGRVLLKKKGEARFAAAKKGAQAVGEGTAVQVGPGGKAKLAIEGATVKLGAGTTGTVDSAAPGEDGNELGLTVNGAASVVLDGKKKAAVKLGGKQPVTVRASTEAAVNVNKGRVEVLIGEVELETNGKKQVVKAGEVATVGGGAGITVAQKPKPALTLPMGKKVRVYAKRPLGEVALDLPDEKTRMQVATDAAFTDVVLSGSAQDFVAVQAPVSGDVFWRTLDEKGEATSQGRARFMPETSGGKDDASHSDVVAETGLKATVFFQAAVPALTFTFPEVVSARGYRLRVYKAGDLSKPIVDKKVNEAKATVEQGVLGEGSYRWSASALDEAGNDKVGGRMNQMDIVFDNSLTTLHITSPRDGEKADGAKAVGTAPLGSKLFVNGKPLSTDGSGRFNAALPKGDGVVFRLVMQDGSEAYWFRRLKK